MSFNPIAPLTLWSVHMHKTQVKNEIVDQLFLASLGSVYCSHVHTYIPQKRWPNFCVDWCCRKVKISAVRKKVILWRCLQISSCRVFTTNGNLDIDCIKGHV